MIFELPLDQFPAVQLRVSPSAGLAAAGTPRSSNDIAGKMLLRRCYSHSPTRQVEEEQKKEMNGELRGSFRDLFSQSNMPGKDQPMSAPETRPASAGEDRRTSLQLSPRTPTTSRSSLAPPLSPLRRLSVDFGRQTTLS